MSDFIINQVKDFTDMGWAGFQALTDGDLDWDNVMEEVIQWGKHSNAPFRDARKVYENYMQ